MKNLLSLLFPINTVYAHCDIPCGIYDPHTAQVAAHSVLRMNQMMEELNNEDEQKFVHQMARLNRVKEEHADIVKTEVRIIWGDYFKPEMLKDHPNLHELVFNIMKQASKTRHNIDVPASKELIKMVGEFAEIFYKTKGFEVQRVKTPYPTEGEIVINK